MACHWAVICLKPEGHPPQLREVRPAKNEFPTGFRFFVFRGESVGATHPSLLITSLRGGNSSGGFTLVDADEDESIRW